MADDEIRERYLDRAIRELQVVEREVRECAACESVAGSPVLSSGHPLADVMLIGYEPSEQELAEGVAFFGRAGDAILKSLKRLEIDPTTIYGALIVKCPPRQAAAEAGGSPEPGALGAGAGEARASSAAAGQPGQEASGQPGSGDVSAAPSSDRADRPDPHLAQLLLRELAIVEPRVLVVNGERALRALNDLRVPASRPLIWNPGAIQRFTPTCDAIVVPDIHESLDEDEKKRAFWRAFRQLGEWWNDQPPW